MEFFKIDEKNKTVIVNSDLLTIPEFLAIWESDDSENKTIALKEFTYLWYVTSYRSPGAIKGLPKEDMHSAGLAFARLNAFHKVSDATVKAIDVALSLLPPSALVVKTLRTSLHVLNTSVNRLVEQMAIRLNNSELKDVDITFLISAQSQISSIAEGLPKKFQSLKEAEVLLIDEEKRAEIMRGKKAVLPSHKPENTED